jgi:hypothetical protein
MKLAALALGTTLGVAAMMQISPANAAPDLAVGVGVPAVTVVAPPVIAATYGYPAYPALVRPWPSYAVAPVYERHGPGWWHPYRYAYRHSGYGRFHGHVYRR